MATANRDTVPSLPALEPGITRIETDERATGALASLVLDRAMVDDGPVWWVDSNGHARTGRLARLAPSMRTLERLRVARAFTPYQHSALVQRLTERVTDDASLAVCPALDGQYRSGDAPRGAPRRMVESAVTRLRELADAVGLTVLVTCRTEDALSGPIVDAADRTLRCERTQFGPRFVGTETETLVYEDATGVQTTLAFWARVLTQRRAALEQGRLSPTEVLANGAD